MQTVPFFFAFLIEELMFYRDEDNNSGSKDMTVNSIDKLIMTKILKASGFIQSQAKASIVTCHEAQHENLLEFLQQK